MHDRSLLMRWATQFLLIVAVLTFFFPMVSMHVPIMGNQSWSGYDMFSAANNLSKGLHSMHNAESPQAPPAAHSPAVTPQTINGADNTLVSVESLPLVPVEIALSLIAALIAGIFNLRQGKARLISIVSLVGMLLALLAVIHVSIANSSLHTWMQAQMSASSDPGNPFSGLADAMMALAIKAFQVKAGTGLYVLAATLAGSAVLSRVQVFMSAEPAPIATPQEELL